MPCCADIEYPGAPAPAQLPDRPPVAAMDPDGRLVLPAGTAARYGFRPGATVHCEERDDGLFIRRPLTHLAKVYLEATNRCNLDCRTCIRRSWEAELGMMAPATAERALADLRDVSPPPDIVWGGWGEPLLHPDIVELVTRSKRLGGRVSLITNGTLLSGGTAAGLLESGLDMLWVSMDGVSEETFSAIRLGATLAWVVANVDAFQALQRSAERPRTSVGFVFVAMRRNQAELPALLRLGDRLDVRRILASNLMPHTAEMQREVLCAPGSLRVAGPDAANARVLTLPRLDSERMDPSVFSAINHAGWHVEFKDGAASHAPGRCPFVESGALVIGWDGRVGPCLDLLYSHIRFVAGKPRHAKPFVTGNVAASHLESVWRSPEYVSFRDRVRGFDYAPCHACSGCDLSATNETDCYGNPFPTCGGCPWAHGVILCP